MAKELKGFKASLVSNCRAVSGSIESMQLQKRFDLINWKETRFSVASTDSTTVLSEQRVTIIAVTSCINNRRSI